MEKGVEEKIIVEGFITPAEIATNLADRRTFIGGSDAPVILGLSGYKTRLELWQEKVGEKEPDDLSDIERVQWGIILEAVVAQQYMVRTGKKVRRMNERVIDKRLPWRAAQIDRRIVGGGILEIKTTDAAMAGEWGPEGTAEIPASYYAQVQHQMAVLGENFAEVAVLIGGNRMRLYLVPRDAEFIRDMTTAEEAFWALVQSRTPPEPISLDEATLRWGKAPSEIVQGTDDDGRIAAELVAVKEERKAIEAREDALELALKSRLRDEGDTLMVNGTAIVSWKNQTSKRLDTKALEADLPEIAATYRKESESRVFRVLKGASSFGRTA